jgi:hypothetical protein
MKFAKSILTGTGAVVLAGLILALLVPKAAHAVAATLVQVANTTANPAISQDTSRQASQIVTLECLGISAQMTVNCYQVLPSSNSNSNAQYYVPSGQNLVITSIDYVLLQTTSAPTSTTIFKLVPVNPPCCLSWVYEEFLVIDTTQTTMNLSSGIVVGPTLGPGFATYSTGLAIEGYNLTVHGYLTAN